MEMEIKQHKTRLRDRIRAALLNWLCAVDMNVHSDAVRIAWHHGYADGYVKGVKECKVVFRPVPMPFTPGQLAGGEYGDFITPVGFASTFGECMIPAPSIHGYEMRGYYVHKAALDAQGFNDLHCHYPDKFGPDPLADGQLVPVLVVVLR